MSSPQVIWEYSKSNQCPYRQDSYLHPARRGMAAFVGKDVAKLKAKGGGKWKYMSEQDMLDLSAKFAPYRSARPLMLHECN